VSLGLVTQRPAEIDPNIISQCSTMFVMRLSIDRDQALIRSAISDAGASMLTFVPSLGTGEVFAFGAGVPLPTRMKFREVPPDKRPTSEAGGNTRIAAGMSPDKNMIDSVIDRWRAATMSKGLNQFDDDGGGELGAWRDEVPSGREELPRYQPAPPLQPAPVAPTMPAPPRPSILRRPLTSEPLGPNNPAPLPSRYR
jgi:hypothetical protein